MAVLVTVAPCAYATDIDCTTLAGGNARMAGVDGRAMPASTNVDAKMIERNTLDFIVVPFMLLFLFHTHKRVAFRQPDCSK